MQLMLAISRLTGRQPQVKVAAPPRPSADIILARMAREFDRESRRAPLIDGIDLRLVEVALTNDLQNPKTREAAKRELVRLAEADLSAGRCIRPLVERTLRQAGIEII